MHMNYRLIILFNFYLLLGGMLFSATNCAQASDFTLQGKKESVNHVEKTSSNNIHVDEIVIKNIPTVQPGNTTISDGDQNRLVDTIAHKATEKVISWLTFGSFALIIFILGSVWAYVSRVIEIKIQKYLDTHIATLSKEQIESIKSTTKVTAEANIEIEKTKILLNELQAKEMDIKQQLNNFDNEINLTEKDVNDLKLNLVSINEEFESKSTDEIFRLEQKIRALSLIIDNLDIKKSASESVVDKLITDLESINNDEKYNAAELLPYFRLGTNKITDAFVRILNDNPDFTLESLLLSGLSELKGNSTVMNYLVKELGDLGNPNILAIIGALGKISEKGKTNLTNQELDIIVEKLVSVLNDDLEGKIFSDDSVTASGVRGAIALALSNFGDRAENSVNDLVKLLSDDDQETRKNAAISLGVIGSKAKNATRALRKLASDEYAEVREAASEAIEKIQ
jgi:HEAT repeat protein